MYLPLYSVRCYLLVMELYDEYKMLLSRFKASFLLLRVLKYIFLNKQVFFKLYNFVPHK